MIRTAIRTLMYAAITAATSLVALLALLGWVGHVTDSARINDNDF